MSMGRNWLRNRGSYCTGDARSEDGLLSQLGLVPEPKLDVNSIRGEQGAYQRSMMTMGMLIDKQHRKDKKARERWTNVRELGERGSLNCGERRCPFALPI
jgi:hypothetical protein